MPRIREGGFRALVDSSLTPAIRAGASVDCRRGERYVGARCYQA